MQRGRESFVRVKEVVTAVSVLFGDEKELQGCGSNLWVVESFKTMSF